MADLLFSILAGGVGLGAGDKEEQRSKAGGDATLKTMGGAFLPPKLNLLYLTPFSLPHLLSCPTATLCLKIIRTSGSVH